MVLFGVWMTVIWNLCENCLEINLYSTYGSYRCTQLDNIGIRITIVKRCGCLSVFSHFRTTDQLNLQLRPPEHWINQCCYLWRSHVHSWSIVQYLSAAILVHYAVKSLLYQIIKSMSRNIYIFSCYVLCFQFLG